jgi:cysteine desulfurase/selenocysteine lyase
MGTINPVEQIINKAKAVGALVLLDGAQAVAHLTVDVQKLGCDFYVFSGHKTFGPTGIGVLWGRNLEELQPPTGGGSMISRVSKKKITWADSPRRFEAGTPPIAEAIGLGAALRWLEELPRDRILAHERGLAQEAAGAIRERGGRVWSGEGIVSFALPGIHAHDVAEIIGREDVAVRAGHHCAEILMNRLGERALVRASFAPYNHLDDLQPLLRGIDKSLEIFAN